MTDDSRRLNRRTLLRSALVGGSGLLAASVVGCGDDDATSTPSPVETALPSPTGAADPTGTAGATPTRTPSGNALTWEQVSVSGLMPGERRDHSLVTDGQVLYMFGGRLGSDNLADLWIFDPSAGTWTEWPAAGPPPGRFGHNAVYAPGSSQILVFGGQAGAGFFSDTWAYSVESGEWQERTPGSSPSQRYGSAAAYDPSRGLIVSHGFTNQGRFDDTWAFDPSATGWVDVSASGERPEARCLTRAVWDAARERLVMFGGQSNSAPFLGDLWALQGGAWADVTPSPSPSPRNFYAMTATDPGQAMLFGGRSESDDTDDLWLLDLETDTWTEAPIDGERPTARSGHDSVWLPSERAVYVFGGQTEDGVVNDLWRVSVPEGY